ncbi:MAG: hypothetical protein L3J12_06925 [Spirochaetales bacterium]|nr:hypothetical protein [Spirochaetales bacterium]
MKKSFVLILLVLISLALLSSCSDTEKKTLKRILGTEKSDYENEEVSRERIKELEKGIAEYSRDVDRVVKGNAEIGVYYRMIALEYIDLAMYQLALTNLEKSMDFYPGNPVLSYLAGVSMANIARAEADDGKRFVLFRKSEEYYLAAVRLRSNYSNALYALSVLYMFDLESPEKAAPLLEKILLKNPKDWDAKSLYARYKVVSGDIDSAVSLYDEISRDAWDEQMKIQAGENRDALLGAQL